MEGLKIEYLPIDSIFPYEKNARLNDGEATNKVAASIKEFGFQQPILVDDNFVIITGHTRYKAAKQLGIEVVPVAKAVNLSEEQVKAYRLADNRVAEFSQWDMDLLNTEIIEIETIDMTDFGFDLKLSDLNVVTDEEDDEVNDDEPNEESHRVSTFKQYNLYDYDPDRTDGFYQMPILQPVDHKPSKLIGFNYVLNKPDYDAGVHFYLDDYQFERIWRNPVEYIEKLAEFDCVLTPDFSLYMDMPIAMKIWNTYRSRLIGQIMQDFGLTVIPTVSWAEQATYEFCFDGLPKNATLSISTIGVKRDKELYFIWKNGVDAMIDMLSPKRLIIYGGKIEYDYPKELEVVYIENSVTERMNQNGR